MKRSFTRYQLTKHALAILRSGHPWIFKSHLSSAADALKPGEWLKLVDGKNETVGYGIRDDQGVIGIRILNARATPPDSAHWNAVVDRAIARRAQLKNFTNGYRLLHGENDATPGVVVDVYAGVAVLQTYSAAVDVLGRYLATLARAKLGLKAIVWRLPAKRARAQGGKGGTLFGHPPEIVRITEGDRTITVPILSGQKGGTFLDLRHLRKWISQCRDLRNQRVLNLFSYTGTLGQACLGAGAKEVWNVDVARAALAFGKTHHSGDGVRWIEADVFEWLRKLAPNEAFDLIIVDPPQMASDTTQVKQALRVYRTLYSTALKHLKSRGRIVAACCTSRIERKIFERLIDDVLGGAMKQEANLRHEDDHPVGFNEADYLKVLIYRR